MQFSKAHGAPWPLLLSLSSVPGAGACCKGLTHWECCRSDVHEHFPLPQMGLPLRGTSKMGALSVFNVFSWELGRWPPYVPYKKKVWKIT